MKSHDQYEQERRPDDLRRAAPCPTRGCPSLQSRLSPSMEIAPGLDGERRGPRAELRVVEHARSARSSDRGLPARRARVPMSSRKRSPLRRDSIGSPFTNTMPSTMSIRSPGSPMIRSTKSSRGRSRRRSRGIGRGRRRSRTLNTHHLATLRTTQRGQSPRRERGSARRTRACSRTGASPINERRQHRARRDPERLDAVDTSRLTERDPAAQRGGASVPSSSRDGRDAARGCDVRRAGLAARPRAAALTSSFSRSAARNASCGISTRADALHAPLAFLLLLEELALAA